jgi:very-short-patch-repair endonuclease
MPRKKTNKEFQQDVYDKVKDEYFFLDEYDGSSTEIRCKHMICGHIWKIKPNNFLSNGNRCPECRLKERSKKAFNKLKRNIPDNYIISSNYDSSKKSINLIHKDCGTNFECLPQTINESNQELCPVCNENNTMGKKMWIKNNIKSIIRKESNNNYEFIKVKKGEYKNNKTKIILKHLKCNNKFTTTYNDFVDNKNRCPHCSITISKGEKKIIEILDEYNIKYKHQFVIPNDNFLSNKPYDFLIKNKNILIEFDGEQHDKKKWSMTDKDLKRRKEIDYKKSKKAIKNNYKIFRIKYKYYRYGKLKKILKLFGII